MELARSPAASSAFTPLAAPTRAALAQPLVRPTPGAALATAQPAVPARIHIPVLQALRQSRVVAVLPATGAAASAAGRLPPRRQPAPPQTVPELRERIRLHPLEHRQLIEGFVEARIEHALDRARLSGVPFQVAEVSDLAQALGGDAARLSEVSAFMDTLRHWQHVLPAPQVARLVAMLAPQAAPTDPETQARHLQRWDCLLRPLYWPTRTDTAGPSFLACLLEHTKDPRRLAGIANHVVRQIAGVLVDPVALAQPMAQRVRMRQDALDTFLRHFVRPGNQEAASEWLQLLADAIGGARLLTPPERLGLLADLLAPRAAVTPDLRSQVAGRSLAAVHEMLNAGAGPTVPSPIGMGEVLRLMAPCVQPLAPEGGLRSLHVAASASLRYARMMHPSDIAATFAVLNQAAAETPPAQTAMLGPMELPLARQMILQLAVADVSRARAIAAGLFSDLGGVRDDLTHPDVRTGLAERIGQRLRELLVLFQPHHEAWKLAVVVYEAARAARRVVDDGPFAVADLVRAIATVCVAFPPARQRLMMYALAIAWDRIDPQAQGRWAGFDDALDEALQQEAVRSQPGLAPLVGARVTQMLVSSDDEGSLLTLACRTGDPDTDLAEQLARAQRIAPPIPRYFLHRQITRSAMLDLPHDGTVPIPADRFDAWQRASMAQLADLDTEANDPVTVAHEVVRPEQAVPGAPAQRVVPPFDQRVQTVQGSYLGLEILTGLFHIHRLGEDASSREAARVSRTGLDAARRRMVRVRADAQAVLAGRQAAGATWFAAIEREHAAIVRAQRLADGESAGALDAMDAPAKRWVHQEAKGRPG